MGTAIRWQCGHCGTDHIEVVDDDEHEIQTLIDDLEKVVAALKASLAEATQPEWVNS